MKNNSYLVIKKIVFNYCFGSRSEEQCNYEEKRQERKFTEGVLRNFEKLA